MKTDKFLHFTAGFMIAIITLFWCGRIGLDPLPFLFILPLLAGVAKELYDKKFDWWDILATTLGGWIIAITFL